MTILYWILTVIVCSAATAFISAFWTSAKLRRKVTYMLDAIEDKELNFRFDEKKLSSRKFNITLNRLRNIFYKERDEIIRQEKYYGLMLEHVQTGIVIIDSSGAVSYCNQRSLNLLGISTLSHIRQLRAISDSLYDAFLTVTDTMEKRGGYYSEKGKITLSITAAKATIHGTEVKIVAFNDISSELADTEQDSWTKLIRVLTHEIMNTVTPISSLSDTLLKFDNVSNEVRNGLSAISQSSKGLIKFVETYRDLTKVAPPVKKAFFFKDMVMRVIELTHEEVFSRGATCRYIEKSEDILLYADQNQIVQILINLIKNGIQADAKKIEIQGEINLAEQVIISVTNDGTPISKESQNQIFVPFFTTKEDGTGIGLSLSRQIMRMHNGSLTLTKSDAEGTTFTLTFQ